MGHQVVEQVVLERGEADHATGGGMKLKGARVQDVVSTREAVGGRRGDGVLTAGTAVVTSAAFAGSAQDGAHPQDELVDVERLAEVIIRADLEAGDLVLRLDFGGQEEDRDLGELRIGAHGFADLVAVHIGHDDIQDDQVGAYPGGP